MAAPNNSWLSSYTSSLAGALTPTVRPYYELPQDVYHDEARIVSSAGIEPIYFQLYDGTPCVRLCTLYGSDFRVLTRAMEGGTDRVFGDGEGVVKVDLRVMWPGYPVRTMSLKFDPATTTRASLAQSVAQDLAWYMNTASRSQSELDKYQIDPNGIQVDQVLLRGIIHIKGNKWKAIIFIDNTMNA